MVDLHNIVWLASYPKSGNTWFRAFLTALLNPGSSDIDINNLYQTTIASSRQLFDEMTGISSADLSQSEIDRLRPLVYREMPWNRRKSCTTRSMMPGPYCPMVNPFSRPM